LDLIVRSVKRTGACCRVLDSEKPIILRAGGLKRVVPGEVVIVLPHQR
jgi:hypothetical protein